MTKQHLIFDQRWFDAGPQAPTLAQHQTNIGLTSLVCWEESFDSDGIAAKKYTMFLEFARLRHITGHTHAEKQTLIKVTKYRASNIT